jgi:polyisoprenoid-binding protein YceI
MKTSTDGFADAEIELTIDAASINTANSSRDNHLREYFETEQYPNITFKTNSIDQTDENMYTLRGVFTMHGVSKEIEVQMKHIGTTQSRGKEIAGLYFTATVNRMDYGVGLDLSSVAPEVQLHADIEIIKK